MNLPWFVARAAGLVAWALLALSVTWGFLVSTRVLGRRPRARWLLDLHRFLGGLACIFVGIHLTAIHLDSYVEFSPVQLFVPLTSEYRPVAVAYGIVGFYLLLAIEITSLVMKRLPKLAWQVIHVCSYPLFVLATVHLLTAGTEATNVAVVLVAAVVLAEVTVFAMFRMGTSRRRAEPAPAAEAIGVPPSSPARPSATVPAPARLGSDPLRELDPVSQSTGPFPQRS